MQQTRSDKLIGGSEMNMPQAMLLSRAAIYNNSYNSLGFHFATPSQRVSLVVISLSVVSSSFTVNEEEFDELAAAASRLIDEAEQAHLTPVVQPAVGYPYTARRQQQQRQRLRPQNVRFLGLLLRSVKPDYNICRSSSGCGRASNRTLSL